MRHETRDGRVGERPLRAGIAAVLTFSAALGCGEGGGDAAVGVGGAAGSGGDASSSAATTSASTTASSSSAGGAVDDVPCGECFPVETLPGELRVKAEALILDALDHEALFTLVGALKPMSSGFASVTFPDGAEPASVAELRTILGAVRCGEAISSGLQVFAQSVDGQRHADALLFRRPRFDEAVGAHAALRELAAEPWSSPLELVERVDRAPSSARLRGYGHLFGYPEYAVDFFVQAAEHEAATGTTLDRGFVHLPTFAALTGAFTYAVPVGHPENAQDRALRAAAADVLASYQARRAEFIGPGGAGPVALLRAWFDDGTGSCGPDHAAVQTGAGAYGLPPACWSGLKSCNPITNAGCDGADGWACDRGDDGFACFPPPNDAAADAACDLASGPFCSGGLACVGGSCVPFCCSAADCADGEACAPFDAETGSLGTCAAGGCGGPGAHCATAADCCSSDCHGDHCH